MEKSGLFGLLEVRLTAICIENGDGEGERQTNTKEKRARTVMKSLAPLKLRKKITISRIQKC